MSGVAVHLAEGTLKEDAGSRPFWARCDDCSHCWPIAYLPMNLTLAARLMKKPQCPKCAGKRVFIAKQDNGVLQEIQS